MKQDIDAVMARDPAARNRFEVALCYPGFHAVTAYRAAHWLHGRGLKLLARVIAQLTRFLTGVEIHPGAKIGKGFFIDHGMGVVIGETATIGDDVTIYHDVTLGGTSFEKGIRHPQVGDGVIIGAGAQLLGPIAIGNGARIGSNAVVVADVAENATMVGVPAHAVVPRAERAAKKEDCFDAYALPERGLDDPLTQQLRRMHDKMEALEQRIRELEAGEETASRWEGTPR